MSTVIEKLAEKCRISFQSQYAAVYIVTDELELIEKLVEMDVVQDRLFFLPDKKRWVPLRTAGVEVINPLEKNYVESMTDAKLGDCSDWPCPKIIFLKNYGNSQTTVQNSVIAGSNAEEQKVASYIQRFISAKPDSMLRQSRLIIASPVLRLPKGLENYIEVIDQLSDGSANVGLLPDDAEISDIVDQICQENTRNGRELTPPDGNFRSMLITLLRGYNTSQVKRVLQKALVHVQFDTSRDREILDIVAEEKQQIIKKDGILKLKSTADGDVFTGRAAFEKWLELVSPSVVNAKSMQDAWGMDSIRGVLLCGLPGTGKSLAAKATAKRMGLELVEMNIGSLMGGVIGESEANMARALRTAEAMAPCILFVDELEKGFSGAQRDAGGGDSGTFKRVFATFLTWMQEKTQPCFIVANANSIVGMPEEFFRNGRFDARFAFYMPMYNECVSILCNHLQHANRMTHINHPLFDFPISEKNVAFRRMVHDLLGQLGRNQKFVTGADIATIVQYSLIYLSQGNAHREKSVSLDTLHEALAKAVNQVTPYCDGNNPFSMERVARNYFELLQNGFPAASARVLIERLNDPTGYSGNPNEWEWVSEPAHFDEWPEYDQLLFNKLKPYINRIPFRERGDG